MRRSISLDSDNDDEKNNVTVKSMIVSMIRVCTYCLAAGLIFSFKKNYRCLLDYGN